MSAPFGRREVELSGRRELGPYVILTATDPQARARPGQFYMLAASARWGGGERQRPFLPRAMSAMSAGEDGSVEFLLERVGPGTARLCELAPGEGLLDAQGEVHQGAQSCPALGCPVIRLRIIDGIGS